LPSNASGSSSARVPSAPRRRRRSIAY
jgi:hypothetical protein